MHLSECYRLLGLRMGASYDEIKSSYRRLARQYHPDVNPGEAQQAAQEKFIQLTEAYEKLLEVSQTPAMRQAQRLSRPSSSSQTRRTQAWEAQSTPRQNPQGHSQRQPETHSTRQKATPKPPPQTQSPTPPRSTAAPQESHTSRREPPPKTPPKTPAANDTGLERRKPTIQRDPSASQTDHALKVSSYEQLQQLIQERRFPRAIALVEGLSQRLPNDREVRNWLAIAYYKWGCYLIGTREPDKARIYLNKAIRTAPDYRELWYEVDRAMQRLDVDYL